MRVFGLSLIVLGLATLSGIAATGDQWILGIHHIDEFNQFIVYSAGSRPSYPEAGYSGPQSSGDAQYVGKSYGRNLRHGQARIYWELSGNSINTSRTVPTTTELYSLEFYGTKDGGHNGWQPIESQFRGAAGETFPHDSLIPWVGEGGDVGNLVNHQYIASEGRDDGAWHPIDNNGQGGPHSPSSADFNATGYDGTYMWLTAGSWLYAKWDFNFDPDRTWSAVRLTQVTQTITPTLAGDYNRNGKVDSADYVIWRKGLPEADGFEDGIIDEYDFYVWQGEFGSSAGSGASSNVQGSDAVPEPATLSLLTALCVLGVAILRRCP